MAINSKGSRKIVVEDHEFRWRATGNDGWITVVIWSVENERSKIVGQVGYHHHWMPTERGCTSSSQMIITNRVIREVILHVGTGAILSSNGQVDIGNLEDIYDFSKAVRSNEGES